MLGPSTQIYGTKLKETISRILKKGEISVQSVACYPQGLCWHGLALRELGSCAQ